MNLYYRIGLATVESISDQAKKSLAEFQQFMNNKELYPDVSTALVLLNFALKVFSLLLGITGVIVVMLVVARTAADVVTILTNGWFDESSKFRGIRRFSSFHNKEVPSSFFQYISQHSLQTIFALAFAVLLLSNQMMPLVAKLTGAMGSVVDSIVAIDINLGPAQQQKLNAKLAATNAVNRAVDYHTLKGPNDSDFQAAYQDAVEKVTALEEGSEKANLMAKLKAISPSGQQP